MKKVFILSSLFLFLFFQVLSAQQNSDSLSVRLSDVEVNATRNKLYSEMGRVLTVIDKAEISRSAVQSLDQLLDFVAGMDIRQRGTNGTQADISMRGGTFDQVLVLLNGINITDPQTGHFNLDIPLNLSDVSRVEILQGSAARVLGPNAFSGAINIVTETPAKRNLNAELSAGSFSTYGQTVSGSLSNEHLQTFASLSHSASDGYTSNTDFEFSNAFVHSVLKTKNIGKFELQLAGQLKSFGANRFYSLTYPNQYEHTKTFLSTLNWTFTKARFTYSAQAYWRQHHDRFELDFNKPAGWNYHLSDVTGSKFSVTYLSKIGKTTLGLDVRNEHIYSNKLGTKHDSIAVPFEKNVFFTKEANRLLGSAFIDHSISIQKWFISLGVVATNCSEFGLNGSGGVDLSYSLTDHASLFVSANSAVRLPTFTDLYYESPIQLANPNLNPEKSQTIEFGTKIADNHWKIDATTYYRMGQNVIDWVKLPTATIWESKNLTDVNAFGADVSVAYHFQDFFIRKMAFSYSYLNMDKTADRYDSKYALDYLKNKIMVSLHHQIIDNLSATWKVGYFDRTGNYTNANKVLEDFKSYASVDCRLLWSKKKYEIFADVNNLLDKQYADYGGLTQPGISFNVGWRLKLN